MQLEFHAKRRTPIKYVFLISVILLFSHICLGQNTIQAYSDPGIEIIVHRVPVNILGSSLNPIEVKSKSIGTIKGITVQLNCDCEKGESVSWEGSFYNIKGYSSGRDIISFVDCQGLVTNCTGQVLSIKSEELDSEPIIATKVNSLGSEQYQQALRNKEASQGKKLTPEKARQQDIQKQMREQRQQQAKLREEQRISNVNSSSTSYTSNTKSNSSSNSNTSNTPSNYEKQLQQQQALNSINQLYEQQRKTDEAIQNFSQSITDIATATYLRKQQESERREREMVIQKEKERKREEERRVRTREAERKTALKASYLEGLSAYKYEWPTSSSIISATKIYFYASAYIKSATINDVSFTNIFFISRRDDGSWPFASDVLNELKNDKDWTEYNVNLHGYFSTYTQANAHRSLSHNNGQLNNFKIITINYLPKDLVVSNGEGFDNPWDDNGTAASRNQEKEVKTSEEKFDDPWSTKPTKPKKKGN